MAQITPPLQPDAETAALPSGPSPRFSPATVARDFLTLTKPKIISLLLITAAGGMFMAAEGVPPLLMLAWVWIGGALASGGANAINQHLDRDIDREMSRTRSRPVAGERVAPKYALAFGVALNVAAFALLATLVNFLAAGLTLTASLFYVFVYTLWLKRSTPNNIVIGGAAGAIPPLVGWAAITGSLDLPAVYLFAIVFFWTPPHFWALALLKKDEYARSGVPMLPVVAGDRRTRLEIVVYSVLVAGTGVVPWAIGLAGPLYGVVSAALGAAFLALAVTVWRRPEPVWPTRLYGFSILYLFLLFAFLLVEGGMAW
jgi:protoheme IX farnesyltransferase